MDYQSALTIIASEAIQVHTAAGRSGIQAEFILPESPARRKGRGTALVRDQQESSIFHFQVPGCAGQNALDCGHLTQKQDGQMDEMYPLVDQLAATGNPRVGTPLASHSRPPAVSVTGSQVTET